MCESRILTIDGINIVWKAKVFDEGSIGINKRLISKLTARIKDDWTFNYDGRWNSLNTKSLKKLLKSLLKNINNKARRKVIGFKIMIRLNE